MSSRGKEFDYAFYCGVLAAVAFFSEIEPTKVAKSMPYIMKMAQSHVEGYSGVPIEDTMLMMQPVFEKIKNFDID